MPPSMLPFLYQTRTIQHGLRRATFARVSRLAHSSSQSKTTYSIPFEWEDDPQHDDFSGKPSSQPSTITPSEADIFKGIFDEISQGRMPVASKKTAFSTTWEQTASTAATGASPFDTKARSIVDQARLTDFRDKFLSRYPSSLRNAAQVALGLFELPATEEGTSTYMELKEADAANWAERAMYDQARSEERLRVDRLMESCTTDAELWNLMEREVFSLPARLGIVQETAVSTQKKGKKTGAKGKAKAAEDKPMEDPAAVSESKPDRRLMDIHGRLYPHFIYHGLTLLDNKFKRSSPYAFKILPRVKELGLPSYVLGVSTSFYSRLASLYWTRFGDSNAALRVLQEMLSSGLYANEESMEVVASIRDHLHGCTWGAQGPFVMAMMESSPYDASLSQRLENMQRYIRTSIAQERQDGV
ncbi:hypothetical protein CCM_01161 [Cordyceps militaris CM01]|uniref:Mtf2-like C-terminal domain-containing protein n=1 Tax=Cordyceps militaris (strain CM01) TaxID=983644 RepID=G3J3H6_CORMM|nr:uncharacterized protein CCM_01161 [Cordyceps militaris CM01]EGX96504.1 hypothetical protein CCM_01161 [Cordyceps militaris CM01]